MSMHRLSKTMFWLSLILGVLLLSGCEIINQASVFQQRFPESGEKISAFDWVGVSFSQPMKTSTVEAAFSLSPEIQGEFIWQEESFWFRPIHPYTLGVEYQAKLSGDLETADGQTLSVEHTWAFKVREPELIFFVPQQEGGEIWRARSDGTQPQQLSHTGGKVIDFVTNRTGDRIAYNVQNEVSGRDLWVMDREGQNAQMLIHCGRDVCDEPTWSMDQEWIAYTRNAYDTESEGHLPSQVWTVAVESGETAQLYQSDIAYGHSPSFSPDGKKLATYDTNHDAIRVLDLETSQDSMISREIPGSGDWSPDGSKIIFTDIVPAENEPFVEIYVVDLADVLVETAFDTALTDTDFSQPRWSPDGEWVAVSLRPVNATPSKSLWVLHVDGEQSLPVVEEPSSIYSAYQWDPWGERLIYQRFELGRSEDNTSIWTWDWGTQENTLIIENGARPQWLP